MIRRIRHKGLERFAGNGDTRGINARHAAWLRVLLTALNAASKPDDIARLPGARLHQLKGGRDGQWSAWVSDNWRLVFRFDEGDATDIDLVDHH